jgi:hypothetical protein
VRSFGNFFHSLYSRKFTCRNRNYRISILSHHSFDYSFYKCYSLSEPKSSYCFGFHHCFGCSTTICLFFHGDFVYWYIWQLSTNCYNSILYIHWFKQNNESQTLRIVLCHLRLDLRTVTVSCIVCICVWGDKSLGKNVFKCDT